ncbi:MAG: TrkH family potassium uptake protein [Pseudomonadota bacterium]
MIDLRPAGYLAGWLVAVLGGCMLVPIIVDLAHGHTNNAQEFAASAILTIVVGASTAFACASSRTRRIGVQESFLLATVVWAVFPFFGALPLMLGDPHASFTDAFFEAMSALTTTGATVFTGLDELPPGVLLWRGMLQWFGGLGIIVVAMVFLPTLRVGGMQIFKSEAFDTMGKMLPRAASIAISLTTIYGLLTFFCFTAYVVTGMQAFDALVHSLTTISTGGMATTDASFGAYGAGTHYVSVVFMILAALPFIRFLQIANGASGPFFRDTQIHGFLLVIAVYTLALTLYYAVSAGHGFEPAFREVLFNVTSIATGTGYASADYGTWGPLAVTLFFTLGLIGGCSGSTACSVKVFRYQLLLSAIAAEIRRIHSPNRMFTARYAGRRVSEDVMSSVMAFFMFFYLTLAIVAVLLILVGLEPVTAISGAASAIANIGPGLGPEIGPAGSFAELPDIAKWILAVAMLLGRLELLSVFVLFTPVFWRG